MISVRYCNCRFATTRWTNKCQFCRGLLHLCLFVFVFIRNHHCLEVTGRKSEEFFIIFHSNSGDFKLSKVQLWNSIGFCFPMRLECMPLFIDHPTVTMNKVHESLHLEYISLHCGSLIFSIMLIHGKDTAGKSSKEPGTSYNAL